MVMQFDLPVILSEAETFVGVNIKGDSDLRKTTRSGRNSREFEFAEQVVVLVV